MNFNPRYIKNIFIADISAVKEICQVVPRVGVLLSTLDPFLKLPVVGLVAAQVTSKIQDNQTLYTSAISFELSDTFKYNNRPLVYLLETVTGVKYLLGTPEHPFCRTTIDDTFPGKTSEKSVCKVTVELISKNGLLEVL